VQQGDRRDLRLWHGGDELVEAVARAGVPTVVVVHSVGPVLLERVLAQPSVKAVVWAGLPGQESGNALVDVLFGDVAPSGKLPYTIARREADYGVQVAMNNVSDFVERSYIDYRWFDAKAIAPRYEFGFGLCKFIFASRREESLTGIAYTTFEITNLTIRGPGIKKREAAPEPQQRPRQHVLQDNYYASTGHKISAVVTNTGKVAGAEVAQLYLSLAAQAGIDFPPQQLRGFEKVFLKPGESKRVSFSLRRKDVAYWNVGLQEWTPAKGKAIVRIANSSRSNGVQGELWV
jgi:beta-glucosidase